jgi:hypothetical protein
VLETAKDILLWGSTPDAVLRLVKSTLQILAEEYFQKYFSNQCHESLCDFLEYRHENEQFGGNFIQACIFDFSAFLNSVSLFNETIKGKIQQTRMRFKPRSPESIVMCSAN